MVDSVEDLYFRYRDENHELRKQQRDLEQRVRTLTTQVSRQSPGQMRNRTRFLAQDTLKLSVTSSLPTPPSVKASWASPAPLGPAALAPGPATLAAQTTPTVQPSIALRPDAGLVHRVETLERELQASRRDLEISKSQNFAVSVAEELAALRATVKRLEISGRSEISQTPLGQLELENARLRAEASTGRTATALVEKLKEEKAVLAEELVRSRKFLAQQLAINEELKKLRTSEAQQFAEREKKLLVEISRYKRLAHTPGLTPVSKGEAGNFLEFPITCPGENAIEILISKGSFERGEFLNREDSVLVFSLAPLISDQLLSAVGRGVRPVYDSVIVFPVEISDQFISYLEDHAVQVDLHLLPSEKKIAHGNLPLASLVRNSAAAYDTEIALFAVNDPGLLVAKVHAKFRLREAIADALDAWKLRKQIKL